MLYAYNGVQVLQMDEAQQERFMGLRKQHLNKLRSIYQERQDLNMQVSTPCQNSGTAVHP